MTVFLLLAKVRTCLLPYLDCLNQMCYTFLVHFYFFYTLLVSIRSQKTEGGEKMVTKITTLLVTLMLGIIANAIYDYIKNYSNHKKG